MVRFLLPLFLLLVTVTRAQETDWALQEEIKKTVLGFAGDVGVYVKDIRSGKVALYQSDTLFPTASIVKVPILLGVMDRLHRGELRYDSIFIYTDSLLYAGEDILGSFKSNEKIELKKVIMLMMTTSDNTASLWLQSIAGTGTRINQILDSIGFKYTRVNSRTPGREENRTQYGWGQTTPREMGELLERIYRQQLFSPATDQRILRCMGRNFWDEDEALSRIPPYVEVFSKNGCVNASRSEAMIVNAPHRPFVFCVFTNNNKDQRWTHDNEAWALARNLADLLWNHFEPTELNPRQ
ncbi:MAG: serine hydrolase [Bacteroidetes bacterium]|nr:serine hydrolase [Bacteroidota bacterium]